MWAGFWYGFCTGTILVLLCWMASLRGKTRNEDET